MHEDRNKDKEYCLAFVLRSNLETCLQVKKYIEEHQKVSIVRDVLTTERAWITTKPPRKLEEQT